jgi:isocitrate/isopropylmalate dehydrogenase
MLLTAKMMLEYLGLGEEGARIEAAIGGVLTENKPGTLTYDILRDFRGDADWEKNAASTLDMATAIAQKIDPDFKGERLENAKAKVRDMCDWNKTIGFED